MFDNWYKLKYRLMVWFCYSVCGHPMGRVLSWHLKTLKCMLFPLEAYDAWRGRNKQTGYDFYSNTLLINGMRFYRDMFYCFEEGKIFKIVKIENRIITVEEIIGKNKEGLESCGVVQIHN